VFVLLRRCCKYKINNKFKNFLVVTSFATRVNIKKFKKIPVNKWPVESYTRTEMLGKAKLKQLRIIIAEEVRG
jgi:hypothetical protein